MPPTGSSFLYFPVRGRTGPQGSAGENGLNGVSGVSAADSTFSLTAFGDASYVAAFGNSEHGTWVDVDITPDGSIIIGVDSSGVYMITQTSSAYILVDSSGGTYKSVAISASGQFILVVGNGIVKYSKNGGASWTDVTPSEDNFTSCAMSSDGNYMYMVTSIGDIWTTSGYSGTFGNAYTSGNPYVSITTNTSGQYIYLVASNGGGIVRSTNYGASFSQTFIDVDSGVCVATNAQGNYVTLCLSQGALYSADYGATFDDTGIGSIQCYDVAMSDSGQYQVIGTGFNSLLLSQNYGQSWIDSTSSPTSSQLYVALNATGQVLVVADFNGGLIQTCIADLTNPNLRVTQQMVAAAGFTQAVASTTSASVYEVKPTDCIVLRTTAHSGSIDISLPLGAASNTGQIFTIKDITGNVTTYPTTVNGNGSLIDGSSSFAFTNDYQAISVTFNGANWYIISEVNGAAPPV